MPQTRDYETIIPLPRDADTAAWLAAKGVELGTRWPIDDDVLVWLVRESFVNAAKAFAFELVEFTDHGNIDYETALADHPDLGKDLLERLDRPADDFVWRRFTGLARQASYVEAALADDLAHRAEVAEDTNA